MSNTQNPHSIRFRPWAVAPFLIGLGIICYQGATGVPDINATTKVAIAALAFGFGGQVLSVIAQGWTLLQNAPPRVHPITLNTPDHSDCWLEEHLEKVRQDDDERIFYAPNGLLNPCNSTDDVNRHRDEY